MKFFKRSTIRRIYNYGIGISVFLFFIGFIYLMIKYPPPASYYDYQNIESYPPQFHNPNIGVRMRYDNYV